MPLLWIIIGLLILVLGIWQLREAWIADDNPGVMGWTR